MNPFAQKVAVALALKNLRFERVVSDDPADIRRWSPRTRQLPVLEIDGERRADSNAILDWLDERFPAPSLTSEDPKVAEQQAQLAAWGDASFLFYWDRWRQARFPQPGDEEPVQASLLANLRDRVERLLGSGGAPSRLAIRELEVLSELENRLDDLVGMLGQRPFFRSDTPSIADLTILGMLRVIRDGPMTNGRQMIVSRPTLDAYLDRFDELLGGHEQLPVLPLGDEAAPPR